MGPAAFGVTLMVLVMAGCADARSLLQGGSCTPSASALADVEVAAAEALGGTLSLALAEVTKCGEVEEFDEKNSSLSISLALAITESTEELVEECGDTETAAQVFTEVLVDEAKKEVGMINSAAEEEFEDRSADVLAVVEADVSDEQSRSGGDLPLSPEDRAQIIAKRLVEELQDILIELNCGEQEPTPSPQALRQTVQRGKCVYYAGGWIGRDCP